MAAASSLTSISFGAGSRPVPQGLRNPEDSSLPKSIELCPLRRQNSAILRSQFLGQLEQRRRLLRRALENHGGHILRGRRMVGKARAGLPVVSSVPVLGPVLNAFFNPVVLFIIYAAGASRFWGGFGRTTYNGTAPTKIALTALWPALFLVSAAYRSNFKRAVQ